VGSWARDYNSTKIAIVTNLDHANDVNKYYGYYKLNLSKVIYIIIMLK